MNRIFIIIGFLLSGCASVNMVGEKYPAIHQHKVDVMDREIFKPCEPRIKIAEIYYFSLHSGGNAKYMIVLEAAEMGADLLEYTDGSHHFGWGTAEANAYKCLSPIEIE